MWSLWGIKEPKHISISNLGSCHTTLVLIITSLPNIFLVICLFIPLTKVALVVYSNVCWIHTTWNSFLGYVLYVCIMSTQDVSHLSYLPLGALCPRVSMTIQQLLTAILGYVFVLEIPSKKRNAKLTCLKCPTQTMFLFGGSCYLQSELAGSMVPNIHLECFTTVLLLCSDIRMREIYPFILNF